MSHGFLSIVLHSHLPFVRHKDNEHALEERWLFEAITDCYIPLVNMMDKLSKDNISFKLTMSLSPTLLSMLADPILQQRYLHHIDLLIELAEKETKRLKEDHHFLSLALMYLERFRNIRHIFSETYGNNLLVGFRKHMESGNLEIITCGATHGFFPLMDSTRKSVKAQVAIAVQAHKHFLGRKPEGIWLPECGYYPGDDKILKENGLKYFFTDTHGIIYASKRPKYSVYAPLLCPSGVAAFGRDPESSKQVWSMSEGYPGDYDYREYYRDIGFDLDYGYIWPYIHPEGIRVNTGIKYYRITGKTDDKDIYNPQHAMDKAAQHGENFRFNRENQIKYLADHMDRKPLIVAPYDAELFGHWWFEGPKFLENLIRSIASHPEIVKLITPMEYLAIYPNNQVAEPCMSSWGEQGYNDYWLNNNNDWIYPHLHKAAQRMTELANRFPISTGCLQKALNQAARELLLAQSSDWAFIMKTGSMVEYAVRRTKTHLHQFDELYHQISDNNINPELVNHLEQTNDIFPSINYQVFQ